MKASLLLLLLGACGAAGQLISTGSSVASSGASSGANEPPPSAPPAGPESAPPSGGERSERVGHLFAWREAIDRVSDTVDELRHAVEKPSVIGALNLDATIARLDKLAETCKLPQFAGKKLGGFDKDEPNLVCPLVARRVEITRTAMELAGPAHVASELAATKKQIETLATMGRIGEAHLEELLAIAKDPTAKIARVREELARLYQKLGTEAPAEMFAGFTKLGPDIEAAYNTAANATIMGPAVSKDAAVEKELRRFFTTDKTLRILDVRVMSRTWTVVLHEDHVPNYRSKDAFVLVRRAGEQHCRLYPMEVRQGYAIGSSWLPGLGTHYIETSPYIKTCK